jgi:hypothetical protein
MGNSNYATRTEYNQQYFPNATPHRLWVAERCESNRETAPEVPRVKQVCSGSDTTA